MAKKPANPRATRVSAWPFSKKKWPNGQKKWPQDISPIKPKFKLAKKSGQMAKNKNKSGQKIHEK